ncbi:MAG: hypothetical protein PHE27_04655, partial [Alphaproteobacteria bacterium]|nr:hypothetical protein [Alphaproteobacteria bacterium]
GGDVHANAPFGPLAANSSFHGAKISLSECARDKGQEIFGGWLEGYSNKYSTAYFSIVYTNSPFVQADEVLTYFADLRDAKKIPDFTDIFLLHEGAHGLILSDGIEREMLADAFAVTQYKARGGDRENIQDFIDARRIAYFSGFSLPAYATAPMCEAVLDDGDIPSPLWASVPAELAQSLAMFEFSGQRMTEDVFGNLTQDMYLLGPKERDSRAHGVHLTFQMATCSAMITFLERALEKADFVDEDVREEGEKTIAAYDRLVGGRDLSEAAQLGSCKPRSVAPFGGKGPAL